MSRSYRIADLPADDRPRERLEKLGAQALGSAELIAILLRVGVQGESAVHMGQRILQNIGGLSGLHRAAFDELCAEHGIGSAKAAQIKAAIELGRRLMLESPKDRPTINTAIRNMKTIYCDLSKKQETCPMAELLKWVQRNLRTVFFC